MATNEPPPLSLYLLAGVLWLQATSTADTCGGMPGNIGNFLLHMSVTTGLLGVSSMALPKHHVHDN
eukprot:6475674-Amphidinium_carterae.2